MEWTEEAAGPELAGAAGADEGPGAWIWPSLIWVTTLPVGLTDELAAGVVAGADSTGATGDDAGLLLWTGADSTGLD